VVEVGKGTQPLVRAATEDRVGQAAEVTWLLPRAAEADGWTNVVAGAADVDVAERTTPLAGKALRRAWEGRLPLEGWLKERARGAGSSTCA
jgi:hypothetical protein